MSAERPPENTEQDWRNKTLQWQLQVRATFIQRLAEKLEESRDYPTDTPPLLCKLIWATAKTFSEKFTLIGPEKYSNVNLLLTEISRHLRYVERSQIENTPWSMIQATETFLRKQVGKNYHFIIRPQWSHNYSVIGEFINYYRTILRPFPSEILGHWTTILSRVTRHKKRIFDQKIFCVSFPRIDRLNCLLHANWGHEVGHVITAEWMTHDFPKLWQSEEDEIRKRIEKSVRVDPPPVLELFKDRAIDEIVATHTDTAMETAKQGLTELLCDAIGLYLLGPAAIASHCVFSAPYFPDENPLNRGNYPPWRYRLRLMVQACEDMKRKGSWGSCVRHFMVWLKTTKKIVELYPDVESVRANIVTKEAYDFIERNWKDIRTKVLSSLPKDSKPYNLRESVTVVEALVERLAKDTPPNEIGIWPKTQAASFENILNAAWVFTIRELNQNGSWGTADDFEKLFRLVLKAIESSFVHNVFGTKLKRIK